MKMKSVAGLLFYVKDLQKTAEFYTKLGFLLDKKDEVSLKVRLNWFWLDFVDQAKAEFDVESELSHKGSGVFTYISVENVDKFYQDLLAKGLKPSSEPHDWPWGNREFVLRDPDGYKLVFFKRK
jgi:catechol 2,3-dioxygenase-like lactoylglutathione lyase family enzyme